MNYIDVTFNLLKNNKNIFLTGGAGVGKTTITNRIIKEYEENSKKVAKLASTGMASTLIGGQTLHSFFDFGISDNLEDLEKNSKLEIKKKIKKILSTIDLIVIDEISMVSDKVFEMIIFRLNQSSFNGSLVVVGDFLQLPPIVKNSHVNFAFESPLWKECSFEIVELKHIYRTDDKEFIELLHNVRFAKVDEVVHNHLNRYIKPLPHDLRKTTFLFGKNISASHHNNQQLEFIDNDLFIKEAQVVKHSKSIKDYEIDRFFNDARIEKELMLKIGVPVLFTRNSWNYFNGQKGEVVKIDNDFIYVLKSCDLEVVKLERVAQQKSVWKEKKVDDKLEVVEDVLFTIYQFPIRLAFGITIHKSQGMSIEDLVIQTNEIFSPSQFYVALSRSSNPKNLILIAPKVQWSKLIYVDKKAINFYERLNCEFVK